ncbi:hypothetical protein FACS1894167_01320 [Synergistales bacterium]|nr:hypothetical protein FACS1894167_01320 [Synergistales bacterium]
MPLTEKELLSFVVENLGDTQTCFQAIAEFARHNDAKILMHFFKQCHNIKLNAMEIAYQTIRALLENTGGGGIKSVHQLYEESGVSDILRGVYTIGEALLAFRDFDVERGEPLLRKGVHICHRRMRMFPSEKLDIGFFMQNAFLLECVNYPIAERFPKPSFEIVHRDLYESSPYTVFTISDSVYFRKYFARFAGELREQCGNVNIFLMLVNPEDDVISRAKEYGGMTLASTEYSGRWMAEFCVSSRFMLANDILNYVGGATIFTDVDSKFPQGSAEILSKISQYPLVLCDTGSLYPLLRIDGAIQAVQPTGETFSFFDAASDFMREDFTRTGPIYAFDQMALYRAVCLWKKKGLAVTEINSLIGGDKKFPKFFKLTEEDDVIPLGERIPLRTNNNYKPKGFRPDGRVIWEQI